MTTHHPILDQLTQYGLNPQHWDLQPSKTNPLQNFSIEHKTTKGIVFHGNCSHKDGSYKLQNLELREL